MLLKVVLRSSPALPTGLDDKVVVVAELLALSIDISVLRLVVLEL